MRNGPILLVIAGLLIGCNEESGLSESDQIFQDAFNNRVSDLQVEGQGEVIVLLADDLDGTPHQKFIVELDSEQTLLVSHNIDLAPRVAGLSVNDEITFYGEYEWNAEGGVVHWTHHDPYGVHVDGWIKHNGATYQ